MSECLMKKLADKLGWKEEEVIRIFKNVAENRKAMEEAFDLEGDEN